MNKLAFYLALMALITSACDSTNSQQSTNTVGSFELAIVDSVQIDLLASYLTISDVHKETGDLLTIQSDPPAAYLLNSKGELLNKLETGGDGPQELGSYLLCGEFFEDGIALMGRMKINTYDAQLDFQRSMTTTYAPSEMIYMGTNHLFELEQPDNNLLISYFGNPQTEIPVIEPGHYQEFNIVDVVDPSLADPESKISPKVEKAELFKPIGRLEPNSRYLNGKAFYFLRPLFDVKNNKLYYAIKHDTTLYERALPSGELLSETSIPFDKFILFEGYSMGMAGIKEQGSSRNRYGAISNVFRTGDLTVIIYTSGLKQTEIEALDRASPDFRERLKKADFTKYLILKNGKRVNAALEVPEKVSYFDMADDQGYIWGHQNVNILEDEPEKITFYKLKVVPASE